MKYFRINISLIVLLLAAYIVTLNFTVSEAFRRGEIELQSKVLRQDFQKSEEFFTERLSVFYDQYSGAFNKEEVSKQEFVSRNQNFAISNQSNFR